MRNNCAVILAAGDGTRMKSEKPKVLAEVLFKPMIDWVIDTARASEVGNICVITGFHSELLEMHLDSGVETAFQAERLGTGHAVMQARSFLQKFSNADVLVLSGDAPLIDKETIELSRNFHEHSNNAVTVISADLKSPKGYGRIVRDADGKLIKIVEEREASEEIKAITEVNSGAYWFGCPALLTALDKLAEFKKRHPNKAQEYYLTDAIEILIDLGQKAAAFQAKSANVVLGANNRSQLAGLNEIARSAVLEKHMDNGVSIPFTSNIVIGPDVVIGKDAEILPGTMLLGKTEIGAGSIIGPNTCLTNCKVGNGALIKMSDCLEAIIKDGAQIGPFSRIRPGSSIGENVKLGNFVEVKNSTVGAETKISHLSYIGDADVGGGVNIGSGCATVNYTGKDKYRTVIEDGAFIGCDTSLVAPVTVGKSAYTAAGSTITEDVPENALALARSRQTIKKDWVNSKKPYKR